MKTISTKTSGQQSLLLAVLVGIGATVLTYVLVRLVTPNDHYVRALFFNRGPIQYMTTFCFWVTISILLIKHVRSLHEERAYEAARLILEDPDFEFTLTWTGADRVRQRFADMEFSDYHDTRTFTTVISGLDRLRKTQSTTELDDYFRIRTEVASGELETDYASIRYLIWLIPTLGFIGTVLGIGYGLAGFAEIIQTAESFVKVKAYLPNVTRQLGIAFDTTLLALVLSVFAMLYHSWMVKREEHLLEKINVLCLDGICPLFEEHNREKEEIVEALRDSTEKLWTAMNGNRADISGVILERLPKLIAGELDAKLDQVSSALGARVEQVGGPLHASAVRQAQAMEKLGPKLDGAMTRIGASDEKLNSLLGMLAEIRDALGVLNERLGRRHE